MAAPQGRLRRYDRVLRAVNMALLVLFPIAWAAPLLRAKLIPFFGGTEISILSGLLELWGEDIFLAAVVTLFAVVLPYGKTVALTAYQFGKLPARFKPYLIHAARLSMADVFLIALYIVAGKGIGVGSIATAWGLYLFTGCVLVSLAISLITKPTE